MSQEPHEESPGRMELRGIDWRSCFPFTRIFGTFQLAVHPSKLAMALAAVVLTALWGFALDGLYFGANRPLASEVNAFWQVADLDAWRAQKKANDVARLLHLCRTVGVELPKNFRDRFQEDPGEVIDQALAKIEARYETVLAGLEEQLAGRKEADREAEIAKLARQYNMVYLQVAALAPQGVFRSFIAYEAEVGSQLLDAACVLNFAGGATDVLTTRVSSAPRLSALAAALSGLDVSAKRGPGTDLVSVRTGGRGFGVIACVVLALRGLQWMLVEHFWYSIIFALPVLVVWALFGGAICRMAALNVARDERPAPKVALAFAWRKITGFFLAPLFPIGLVLLPAIALFVGGLGVGIPGLGEVIGGLGLGLALIAGAVIALVLIGAAGGWSLMWPAVAVEGSGA